MRLAHSMTSSHSLQHVCDSLGFRLLPHLLPKVSSLETFSRLHLANSISQETIKLIIDFSSSESAISICKHLKCYDSCFRLRALKPTLTFSRCFLHEKRFAVQFWLNFFPYRDYFRADIKTLATPQQA